MKSKIKISDLRDQVTIHHLVSYNDAATGLPKKEYEQHKIIHAKVRRSIGADINDPDKTKRVTTFEIIMRIDNTIINVEDRVVWQANTLTVKEIEQIDIWYQKLTCYKEI